MNASLCSLQQHRPAPHGGFKFWISHIPQPIKPVENTSVPHLLSLLLLLYVTLANMQTICMFNGAVVFKWKSEKWKNPLQRGTNENAMTYQSHLSKRSHCINFYRHKFSSLVGEDEKDIMHSFITFNSYWSWFQCWPFSKDNSLLSLKFHLLQP